MAALPIPITLSYRINTNRKKETIIILISKKIAHKLNKEFGVPFGENGISSTGKLNGRHKYYLCESSKNLSLLKKLEK